MKVEDRDQLTESRGVDNVVEELLCKVRELPCRPLVALDEIEAELDTMVVG